MQSKVAGLEQRLIIAGFGGQGILTAGKLLCKCCLAEDKNVSFLPSYGSEVRGGTANCHIVISDSEIGSPVVDTCCADELIVLNEPSLRRFGKKIKKNGLLIMNSSLIDGYNPADVQTKNVVRLPATESAADLGNIIVANMIMLGALITLKPVCRLETMLSAVSDLLKSKGKANNVDINLKALAYGAELAQKDYPSLCN